MLSFNENVNSQYLLDVFWIKSVNGVWACLNCYVTSSVLILYTVPSEQDKDYKMPMKREG